MANEDSGFCLPTIKLALAPVLKIFKYKATYTNLNTSKMRKTQTLENTKTFLFILPFKITRFFWVPV